MSEINDILKETLASTSIKFDKKEKIKAIITLIIMFTVTFILWNKEILEPVHLDFLSILIYPIKIFAIFLHYLSHGIVAIITGGHVVRLRFFSMYESLTSSCHFGCVFSTYNWFSHILAASAGYLGNIFFGCLMLYISIRKNWDKTVNTIIGIIMLLITLFIASSILNASIKNLHNIDIVTTSFMILFGSFMILSGTKFSDKINTFILRYLGIVSCLYVFFEMPKNIFITTPNDGYQCNAQVAGLLGMPFLSKTICIIWLLLSILALYFTLKITFKTEEK